MSLNAHQHNEVLTRKGKTLVETSRQHACYDLVCIGFGVTALALAANLADQDPSQKDLYIDRKPHFSWEPAKILGEERVAGPFLHDLITSNNPRSKFTFLNFLHATKQILPYTNVSQLEPTRYLMGMYFRWAAEQIERLGWVQYGQEAIRVTPLRSNQSRAAIPGWSIDVKNTHDWSVSTIRTKRLVFAGGAEPRLPQALQSAPLAPFVRHTSHCAGLLEHISNETRKLNIAVIGADQEAVEIFLELHTMRGQHSATFFVADTAIRPNDDTAFIHEAVAGNQFDRTPSEIRQRQLHARDTPKVNLSSLERLYELQYMQKVGPRDPSKTRFRIALSREILRAEPTRRGPSDDGDAVRLVTSDTQTGAEEPSPQPFDLVIATDGYVHDAHRVLLAGVSTAAAATATDLTVDADYHVNFARGALAPGCGLWVLDSLRSSHARRDDFAGLAGRAGRVARAVSEAASCADTKSAVGQAAML